MNIQIVKAEKSNKAVLRQLLEFYCYDFSEYLQTDVNKQGKYDYPYVDAYWIEADRHPFFIKVEDHYAGFILLNKVFKIIDDPRGYTIAEFFIMRKYRRRGIGKYAAKTILDLFPGPWEIAQVMANPTAVTFWNAVVEEYTNGHFTREYQEKNGLKKQILIFNSAQGHPFINEVK